jgi:DNA/RNA-binding domain of Phe-tRNA-synthetase-like protein
MNPEQRAANPNPEHEPGTLNVERGTASRFPFTVSPAVAAIVRPGVLWLEGATVVERERRMDAPLAASEAAVRRDPPAEITAVRTMYKRVGLDPTKTRPSSEALLRRVRRGEPLPRINSMVDVCNWCSLEFQLPYGLYDAAHIDGDVELRLGREGESYPGIRKDAVHVGGRIALGDRLGPFGNPTSDSARTMVTTATTRALLVVFAPREVDRARLTFVLDRTSERMHEFIGCREVSRLIV